MIKRTNVSTVDKDRNPLIITNTFVKKKINLGHTFRISPVKLATKNKILKKYLSSPSKDFNLSMRKNQTEIRSPMSKKKKVLRGAPYLRSKSIDWD